MVTEQWGGPRYIRQTSLPGFGLRSQKKLSESSVLVVGAGGLGCPAALYLAGAGIGRLGIADQDQIDLSNLQRQILYNTRDIGQKKVQIAGQRLKEFNPDTKLTLIEETINRKNAASIVRDWDLVLDGTDNFQTRYLLHDICYFLKKPYVYGSVFRFEGQAGVFCLPDEPCFRCVFPQPPPPESRPDCSESGVIGAVPGVIGSIQALESIKILAGLRRQQKPKILIFDGLNLEVRHFNLEKNPSCPLCGVRPEMNSVDDAGLSEGPDDELAFRTSMSPEEFRNQKKQKKIMIIDVREPWEYKARSVGGMNIPLDNLEKSVLSQNMLKEDPILLVCARGMRSYKALQVLQKIGYTKLKWLRGGIEACQGPNE